MLNIPALVFPSDYNVTKKVISDGKENIVNSNTDGEFNVISRLIRQPGPLGRGCRWMDQGASLRLEDPCTAVLRIRPTTTHWY